MKTTKKCFQLTFNCPGEGDALEALAAMRVQDGFLGGRVLEPSWVLDKEQWRVQWFMECASTEKVGQITDELRVVIVPGFAQESLGFV